MLNCLESKHVILKDREGEREGGGSKTYQKVNERNISLGNKAWWLMSIIPAHGTLKQEDSEFEASPGYTSIPCHSELSNKSPSQNANKNIHCNYHSDILVSIPLLSIDENISVLTGGCSYRITVLLVTVKR